ncbi:MAG: hypothetical protein R2791_11660 [Saprospiraceae bacterium]
MNTKIIEKHCKYLNKFIDQLNKGTLKAPENIAKKLLSFKLSVEKIDQHYSFLNEARRDSGNAEISYIHALRDLLQNAIKLHYRDALFVISEVFSPLFNYTYTKAVKNFLTDKLIDRINAQAEWRAFFEYRFLYPIESFAKRHLESHWLTCNFNLFSFLGNQNLPPYRMHINIPDKHHPSYSPPKVPYELRENDFNSLAHVQGKYSTVWEIVGNNVSSIFYFDKTADHPKDMIVYEINPDVEPGKGRVDPAFTGKFKVDGSERPVLHIQVKPGQDPEKIFGKARQNDPKERQFQYSIIRFFIRSGIFNPSNAAYHIHSYEPGFKDLLKTTYAIFDKKRNDDRAGKPINSANMIVYDNTLMAELGNMQLKDFVRIAEAQYKSSQQKDRLPIKNALTGTWDKFDYDDKYSETEDHDLDKLITLFDLIEPEALNVRLSIFEAGFFGLTQEENTVSHIYWLPVIINWREQLTGGVVFLNSDKRISPEKIIKKDPEVTEWEKDDLGYYEDGSGYDKWKEIFPDDPVPQEIISILYYTTGLFTDKQIGEIEESIRAAAERSAAVSIMSRNISHNIGSHVLSYLKNLLSDERTMLKEGVLEDLIVVHDDGTISLNEKVKNSKDRLLLPYIRSIGRLLGYFQERQDYIGTFASDRYLYFSPLFFKEAVVDYFYGKLKVTSADGDRQKDTRNLTLDYIINSEGYRDSDIEIKTFWDNRNGEEPDPIDIDSDIEIALPSGNTGRQGIYTILENFIRNSAKHGSAKEKREDGMMKIKLVLSDAGPDYYRLEVSDNSGNTSSSIVDTIQKVLADPLIKKDGNPDERHKGIKEIQIAAGWLRGVRPHDLLMDPPPNDLPVLTVECLGDYAVGKGNLKYTFYLRKPKPGLLVVANKSRYFKVNPNDRSEELKDEFKKQLANWTIREYGDPRMVNPDKVPYRFVVIHKELEERSPKSWQKTYIEIFKRSPARILTGWTDEQLRQDDFNQSLYEAWLDGPQIFDKDQSHSRFNLGPDQSDHISHISKKVTIGIEDPKRPHHFKDDAIRQLVVDETLSEAREQDILFREHNDQPLRFDEFCNDVGAVQIDRYLYLEGISGDNSTNRIIRHEMIDNLWRFKMLEAALTKVIIIDERIWKNNFGDTEKERARNHLRWSKKNIHILSLEFDVTQPDLLCMKDLQGNIVATINKLGEPAYTSEAYKLLYRDSHFISLHQGLLERAVKHCADGLMDMTEQEQVNVLFKRFRDKLIRARFRVIIHSGRSKTHILPYPTAFVQLSALGSALRDCKLTLCELFYSTIQEEYTS